MTLYHRQTIVSEFLDYTPRALALMANCPPLIIVESKVPFAQLLPQHAVLLAQIIDLWFP
jgi:hypothetical protein